MNLPHVPRTSTDLNSLLPAGSQAAQAFGDEKCCCSACGADFDMHVKVLPCSHLICRGCSKRTDDRECPVCASQLPFRLSNAPFITDMDPCLLDSASGAVPGGGAGTASPAPATRPFVSGFGTKIDAIVFDLITSHCAQDAQDAQNAARGGASARPRKSLVFSQFAEVLLLIGNALKANGVKFLHLKHHGAATATTVSRFKTDAGVQVLLLPLKTGNHGMSLAEAQRVFIVEPCLIPAIEAQATARVRRLNQTERTFVHRYAMLGTVEQVISRAMMPRLQQLELKFEAAPSLSAAEWSHPLTRHDLFVRPLAIY